MFTSRQTLIVLVVTSLLIASSPLGYAAASTGRGNGLASVARNGDPIPEDEPTGAVVIDYATLPTPDVSGPLYSDVSARSDLATSNPSDVVCDPADTGTSTVWFKIPKVLFHARLYVRTSAGTNDFVSVFSGAPGSLVPVGCASSSSGSPGDALIELQSGADHYLMVHGNFKLGGDEPQASLEDEIGGAKAILHEPVGLGAPIDGYTTAADDPNCAGGTNSVWYRVSPAFDDTFRIDTSGSLFDTAVGVYTGSRGNLTEVACADDTGAETFTTLDVALQTGETYFVMVVKKGISTGSTLLLSVTPLSGVIFADGFEAALFPGGQFAGWEQTTNVGISPDAAKLGQYGAVMAGTSAYLARAFSPAVDDVHVAGWFKRTDTSTGFLMTLRTSGLGALYGVRTTASGALQGVNLLTNEVTTSSVILPIGQWTYLELAAGPGGPNGAVSVWRDGQPVGELWGPQDLGNAGIGIINLGDTNGANNLYLDALAFERGCIGSCPDYVPPSDPSVSVSPTRGTVNIVLNTTLSGWAGSTDVQIRWKRTSGSTFVIAAVRTDATGGWSGTLRVPATPGGTGNQIQFVQGSITKTVAFEVVPRIKVTPDPAQRNQTVDVSLRGYGKQEVVRIRWKRGSSWVQLATVTTSNTGSANVAIQVPSWAADGEHSVRGDGSTFRAQTNVVTVSGGGPVSGAEEPTATATPTPTSTPTPTATATAEASPTPTAEPTSEPTAEPTVEPTIEPTEEPTTEPSPEPTLDPTVEPTAEVSPEPTATPTEALTPEA